MWSGQISELENKSMEKSLWRSQRHPGNRREETMRNPVVFRCSNRKYISAAVLCLMGLIILKVFQTSVPLMKPFSDKSFIALLPLDQISSRQNETHGKSRSLPIRVLIVAYYRSGSTLIGSIFDDFGDAFYHFEPLAPLYAYTVAHGHLLKYFNGTTRKCPRGDGEDRPIAKSILSAVFNCRFQDFDVDAITMMQCAAFTNKSAEFCDCKTKKPWTEILASCIPDYSKLCLQSTYRVVKTIRVDMDMVESLLEIYPDLKIIHVLRDPRGRVCSRIISRNCDVNESYVRQVCERGTRDVLQRKLLEKKYPSSFKEVIYEDMVADPIRIAAALFTFINATLPNFIKVTLQKKTRNGGMFNGPYGTYRKNGLETAYKWSKSIPWSVMVHVNYHCQTFLELGKFPHIRNKEELMSFKIPDRRRTQT